MKKLIALFTVAGFLTFGMANMAFAQNEQKTDNSAQTEEVAEAEEAGHLCMLLRLRLPAGFGTCTCVHRIDIEHHSLYGGSGWFGSLSVDGGPGAVAVRGNR